MKNVMFFAFLSLLLCQQVRVQAQETKLTAQFFQAYALNSIPLWEDGIAKMEESIGDDATTAQKLSMAKIYYAASTNYMANKKKDVAGELLKKSEELLTAILREDKKAAEANALLSGVYGLQIGLSPIKGMTLGSKSGRLLSKALKEAPDNAIVHHFRGSNLFYTPSMFGGDVDESKQILDATQIGVVFAVAPTFGCVKYQLMPAQQKDMETAK